MHQRSGQPQKYVTYLVYCLICLGALAFPRQRVFAQKPLPPGQPDQPHTTYLPLVQQKEPQPVAQSGWLAALNALRAQANLPPVTENPALSVEDAQHAQYIVKTARAGHSEEAASPWYSAAGQKAAQNSNVYATSDARASDEAAIQSWMLGPFHAAGILDPRLEQVGFGSFRDPGGTVKMAAALNVLSGLDFSTRASYPVIWPANGQTVSPVGYAGNEYPDPLTGCPGYQAPSGLPLIVQLGPGSVTPQVSAITFTRHGQPLEACIFDETSYTNPDPSAQALGRKALNMRDTLVLIPRLPLEPGASYTASITANGQTITWSFSVAPTPAALPEMP